MSSSDAPDRTGPGDVPPGDHGPARSDESLLFERLVFVLVEKGILTRNDALGVVETVAQVTRGAMHDPGAAGPRSAAAIASLERMFGRFEALEDRPGVVRYDGDNVHRLRPPLHGDRPEFPGDD